MTEQENKAIKWMKNVRDDAVATLDHIAKEEPNVSPMLYAGRKEKAETIIKGFEELEQYRTIVTPEECRAAVEKRKVNKELESHDEKHILKECIILMQGMVDEFAEWYKWIHGEDAISELDEEERFCVRKSYFRIVQKLFLFGTRHSGGTSTRAKCKQLGVDSSEEITFDWSDEE